MYDHPLKGSYRIFSRKGGIATVLSIAFPHKLLKPGFYILGTRVACRP